MAREAEYGIKVSCRLLGRSASSAGPPQGADDDWFRSSDHVAFEWELRGEGIPAGFARTATVRGRWDSWGERGVQPPAAWKGLGVRARVHAKLEKENADPGSEYRCELLGIARRPRAAVQVRPTALVPGAAWTARDAAGRPADVIACAHHEGPLWFCCRIPAARAPRGQASPFLPDNLELLSLDPATPPPRHRIRMFPNHAELLRLRIEAAWRAAELRRATREPPEPGPPLGDLLEPDPFLWQGLCDAAVAAGGGNDMALTQRTCYFAWHRRDGAGERTLVSISLHNLLHYNRGIPRPREMELATLQARLGQAALRQGDAPPFCPCRYLGQRCRAAAERAGDATEEKQQQQQPQQQQHTEGEGAGAGSAATTAEAEPTFEPDPRKWEPRETERDGSWRPSHETVWFEWEHVVDAATGAPRLVSIAANDLLSHGRPVPLCPLREAHVPRGLRFSLEFMDAVADRVAPGTTYAGIAYEGERTALSRELPNDGRDIADTPVYWRLNSGRVVCWSLIRLVSAAQDELHAEDGAAEYEAVGKELGYQYLGAAPRSLMADLLEDPGTLAERRWKAVPFTLPESGLSGSWWITNPLPPGTPAGAEWEEPPRFLYKCLSLLSTELQETRVATVGRMSTEHRERAARNHTIMAQLSRSALWCRKGPQEWVQGFLPAATAVGEPTTPRAREIDDLRKEWAGARPPPDEGHEAEAEWNAVSQALADLRSTNWKDVHRERFSATPLGLFRELERGVEHWESGALACADRRRRRLQELRARLAADPGPQGDDSEEDGDEAGAEDGERKADQQAKEFRKTWKSAPENRPDPDGFVPRERTRLPKDHELATQHGKEALLDHVRTLLDLHYDEAARARVREARAAARARKEKERRAQGDREGNGQESTDTEGEKEDKQPTEGNKTDGDAPKPPEKRILGHRSKVFAKVSEAITHQRYENFELPPEVKALLRSSADERSWKNADELRRIVRGLLELREDLELHSPEEVRLLAEALDAGAAPGAAEATIGRSVTVGGVRLVKGTRVEVPRETVLAPESPRAPSAKKRRGAATRPPTEASKVRRLVPGPSARVVARRRPRKEEESLAVGDLAELIFDARPLRVAAKDWRSKYGDDAPLLVAETFDGLLLQLGMLLWCEQVENWNRQGRAWTSVRETTEAARWFAQGQRLGSAPLYDGMCARCGELLFGHLNQCALGGNRTHGPPIDADDQSLPPDPNSLRSKQPPFLLRWSPRFFAAMAPAVFEWSEETNRLALKPDHRERPPWVLRGTGRTKAAAEQPWQYCKCCHDALFRPAGTDPAPAIPFRDKRSAGRMRPDPKTPSGPDTGGSSFPQNPEYVERWDRLRARHSRAPGGRFGDDNLVPVPQPELWQDAPEAPLEQLRSHQGQGQLAVGRLYSSMEQSGVKAGQAKYAHAAGELHFAKRNPRAIASTLAFMVGKNDGAGLKIKPDEIEPVRESLRYLQENNPHLQRFWSLWEQFKDLWRASPVPVGSGQTPVRPARAGGRRKGHAVAKTVEGMLGDEEEGLVIVDPAEMPPNWKGIAELAAIGTAAPRLGPDPPAPGAAPPDTTTPAVPTTQAAARSPPPGPQEAPADERETATRAELAAAARNVQELSNVTLGDPHLDAKLFPHLYPYGSGSHRSETASVGLGKYLKALLRSLDDRFRKSAAWKFFNLDRIIKNDLYFKERNRRARDEGGGGTAATAPAAGNPTPPPPQRGRKPKCAEDGGAQAGAGENAAEQEKAAPYIFGHADPSHVPESRGWWGKIRKGLYAITEDHELGLMSGMVTVTQNDRSPELLAHVRRGPCAAPTEEEQYEYLLSRRDPRVARPKVHEDPGAAVLSFQRRTLAIKQHFLRLNRATPLGVTKDYFDRTEAQNRGSLHSHILFWAKRRRLPPGYVRMPSVPAPPEDAEGPTERERPPPEKRKEDHPYYFAELARVNAELVRPLLTPSDTKAQGQQHLLWGFLLRSIQTQFYIHSCTVRYCMLNRHSCRFFFPWPEQPEQQFDDETERTAFRRRYKLDDQWVVPHNLYLAAFSTATVNVLLFDPEGAADTARNYATKYVAKPEQYAYMETSAQDGENPVKRFLETRISGACMATNRIAGYRVVRCTRPVEYIFPQFTADPSRRWRRDPEHKTKNHQYPDPDYYLAPTQKYFFRGPDLRHMRIAQVIRYFSKGAPAGRDDAAATETAENTCNQDKYARPDPDEDGRPDRDVTHRHYDAAAASLEPGMWVASANKSLPGLCRRRDTELAVARSAEFVPVGENREQFYEKRLLEALPWYCPAPPEALPKKNGRPRQKWTFRSPLPPRCELPEADRSLLELTMNDREPADATTFELRCERLEGAFERAGLTCPCCKGDYDQPRCTTCTHALGFHECEYEPGDDEEAQAVREQPSRWKPGSLHSGKVDLASSLASLARRHVPRHEIERLLEKAVEENRLDRAEVDEYREVYEKLAAHFREVDIYRDPEQPGAAAPKATQMTLPELREELARREACLRQPPPGTPPGEAEATDQWRLYEEITADLGSGRPARYFVQASAGTGKSFLLETLAIWCEVNGHRAETGAPTGIAAARIHVPRTPVCGLTNHQLFALRADLSTGIDLSRLDSDEVRRLAWMTVLCMDEVSMVDDEAWHAMRTQLSDIAAATPACAAEEPEGEEEDPQSVPGESPAPLAGADEQPALRRATRKHPRKDGFGRAHLIQFGDLKQLPPATNRPPYIATDPEMRGGFKFRSLRQNRRVRAAEEHEPGKKEELDEFHEILDDIAFGRDTPRVRRFVVEAYVRGGAPEVGSAERVPFEGYTAVFSKRVYRDRWNRSVMKRLESLSGRGLKVKACYKAQGSRAAWFRSPKNIQKVQRRVRSQSLQTLRLAGQWKDDLPRGKAKAPILMRAMLVANIHVPQRFANGATGRVLRWEPNVGRRKRAVPAKDERVAVRFCHEASLGKRIKMPGIDFIDVTPRQEAAPHQATQLQVPIGPGYAQSIHKMQSLSVPPPNRVQGCLEGVFAHGQFYVLTSRVTDPACLNLIGLPPGDLLDEVAAAWEASGLDVESCLRQAAKVTGEWEYSPAPPGTAPTTDVRSRLTPKVVRETTVPRRLRPLREILNPQPRTAAVLHRLLDWIDRADLAAREGAEPPEFAAPDGTPILPEDEEEEWWLTELERRKRETAREEMDSSDPDEDPQEGGENKPDGDESDDEEDSEFDLAMSGGEEDTDGSGDDGDEAGEGTRKGREEGEKEETYEDEEDTGGQKARDPSDGAQAAANGPNSSSSTRTGAHKTPRRTPSRRGLENLGNTCFMNAVVQAVCGTGDLAARLVAEPLPSGGETVPGREETRRLFQELTSARRHPFSARELHRWLRNTLPCFDNDRQHDAGEFFIAWRNRLAAPVPVADTGPRPVWADWREQWRMQPDIRVHCEHCGKPATPPKKQPEAEFELFATISRDRSYTGVADALRQEHTKETVEDCECDHCGMPGVTRLVRYTSAPRVLAVNLKRFDPTPRGRAMIATPVPVEREIDLAEHLEPNGEGEMPHSRYRIRAIVEHLPGKDGMMDKGHYVCWVREGGDGAPESWIEYDDRTVRPALPGLPDRVHSGAYLLLYEQTGAPAPEPEPPAASSTPDGQHTDVIMDDA